jgi:citrate lyase subunit beta/citryl-CoA lyase
MRRNKHFLYVPGDSARKIESALALTGGAVILDLEDGVAESQKQLALENIQKIAPRFESSELWVRLNQLPRVTKEFNELKDDENIAGFWLPKAEADTCTELILEMSKAGKKVGVLIETATAYVQRNTLLATPGITHVQLGEYDLAGDLGIQLESEATQVAMNSVRLDIAIASKAAGLESTVGAVSANFKDLEEFEKSCVELADLGFDARACIHPNQLPIANRAFTPSSEQIAWANDVIQRFERETSSGLGAYVEKDGSMADAATVKTARSILERTD